MVNTDPRCSICGAHLSNSCVNMNTGMNECSNMPIIQKFRQLGTTETNKYLVEWAKITHQEVLDANNNEPFEDPWKNEVIKQISPAECPHQWSRTHNSLWNNK